MTSIDASSTPSDDRSALRANCADCFALCCTAFGFQRSTDFPIDKPAGTPCLNLADDFSCTIHESLRPRGFRGCTVFDCFGAGQLVSQELFSGTSWRDRPDTSPEMFATFSVVRQLQEMRWYLVEAAERMASPDIADHAHRLDSSIQGIIGGGTAVILDCDIASLRDEVRHVLVEASEEARGGYLATAEAEQHDGLHPSADLAGRDLRARRLCGADLRGATLIAADLRGVDLSGVDLLGADLRGARLDGADLSDTLFLTQMQLNAALGDESTLLPPSVDRPGHWRG
ncbi:pentapeptide repeat-containing protein [Plantibacter sp. MPB07]|uniref:pentapeptide repeat-containing protein n=1 Tax=Plantibacter sp. MPB07 TaxID=3388853 RepID=UPI0039877633